MKMQRKTKCIYCGGKIPPKRFYFCSKKCITNQHLQKSKEATKKKQANRTEKCIICKKQLEGQQIKHCSSRCKAKAKNTVAKKSQHKWYLKNKERLIGYQIKYQKKRYKENPGLRIHASLRRRLQRSIKGKNISLKIRQFVGCSIEELQEHIEGQFVFGMIWDNYGLYGWHIDHIIPCKEFDLTKESEQAKCFHYTNLQPLWAKDNWSKGSSIERK